MKNLNLVELDEEVLVEEETDLNKKVVVYNDDINSFEHVIACFVAYCKHDWEQAEQCAMIVHTKGRCSIKEGVYDELKPVREALCEAGIDAKIE